MHEFDLAAIQIYGYLKLLQLLSESLGHESVTASLIKHGAIVNVEDYIANKKPLYYAIQGRNDPKTN